MHTVGYAAQSATTPLEPFTFDRRDLRADDVAFEILYCGVCHTDLHYARNDWGVTTYPVVPGHELVGRVTAIGNAVTRHRVGDIVAVGTMTNSCGECDQCRNGNEQRCRKTAEYTYGSHDLHTGAPTYGGYSKHMVARDRFVLSVPPTLDPSRVAPLVCAGITTYSPLKDHNVGPGTRVGVVGIGGLGHLAVKLAVGLGADVTVITRSESKAQEARALGAQNTLLSTSDEAMQAAASSLDLIIDTIPTGHDVSPYLNLLDLDGTLVLVGAIGRMDGFDTWGIVGGHRSITGSGVGGIARTQELLDLCGDKNILPDVEMIPIQQINEAFVRVERGDVRYRFVIDMSSLSAPEKV